MPISFIFGFNQAIYSPHLDNLTEEDIQGIKQVEKQLDLNNENIWEEARPKGYTTDSIKDIMRDE